MMFCTLNRLWSIANGMYCLHLSHSLAKAGMVYLLQCCHFCVSTASCDLQHGGKQFAICGELVLWPQHLDYILKQVNNFACYFTTSTTQGPSDCKRVLHAAEQECVAWLGARS